MTAPTRRIFMLQLAAGTSVLTAGRALAQGAPAKVDPKDPQAVALGYVEDTAKADQQKYPNHKPDQACAGCQLYSGKAGDKTGPCSLFAGKHVTSGGWCSAWTKKA
jgi:hypothetical protein